VTRVCELKERLPVCSVNMAVDTHLVLPAVHWTKIRESRLTASWNIGERRAACRHAKRSEQRVMSIGRLNYVPVFAVTQMCPATGHDHALERSAHYVSIWRADMLSVSTAAVRFARCLCHTMSDRSCRFRLTERTEILQTKCFFFTLAFC
jgi:hypothetical protein